MLVSGTLPKCPKDLGCNGLVIAESYTEVKLNDLRKLVKSLLLLRLPLLPIVTTLLSYPQNTCEMVKQLSMVQICIGGVK